MADIERLMISKIIEDEDVTTAARFGIRVKWFEDPEHKKVYQWIVEHRNRYGQCPSRDSLKHEFPTYKLIIAREPYDYYVDKFRLKRERSILVDTITDASTLLDDEDSKGAQGRLSAGLLDIGREVSSLSDSKVNKKYKERLAGYEYARQHKNELTGISTGFSKFDYITGGYHPEQFILYGGAPKQCKSFMLLYSAMAAQDAGYKVLFVTFEMSQKEQEARYDAIASGVNANHVYRGYLDDEEMKKLKRGIVFRRNLPEMVISADISATTTVTGLTGKIDEHGPDIVFVDGCYLMENDIGAEPGTPRAYTAISRGLKRLAQRQKIPIIGTTQALLSKMGKDGAVTMNSFGWTSAWAQDADGIMGVEKAPETGLIRVRAVAGRNFSSFELIMSCDWNETAFAEVEEDSDEDGD
jgi:replicative DNA helicase